MELKTAAARPADLRPLSFPDVHVPDSPSCSRRSSSPPGIVRNPGAYAELHCRTNFSFLQGASHPDELVNRAAELGLAALAITDQNSVAGVVRAHVAAKQAGLKLLIGAEITLTDAPPVVLLATNRAAYAQLSMLITHGRRKAPKGECVLSFDDLSRYTSGLLACVPLKWLTVQERAGGTRPHAAEIQSDVCVESFGDFWLRRYRECFGHDCYGLAELHQGSSDALLLDRMRRLADAAGIPVAAANDVYYHSPRRQPLQDVLSAIRHGCTVAELGPRRFSNAERHLKSEEQMRHVLAGLPGAVSLTLEIAGLCEFSLD